MRTSGELAKSLRDFISARVTGLAMGLPALISTTGFLGSVVVTETTESRADGSLLVAGVIDDEFVSRLHLAEIFYRRGIGDAVPLRLFVTLEIGEGVCGRFGFQQVVRRHEVTSVR